MTEDQIPYVNTDVQIQKVWGFSGNRESLHQHLADRLALTSWYVLLEYKATMVLGFVRFYNYLKDYTLEDALAIARAEFYMRYKNYVLAALEDLWRLGIQYGDKKMALRRLETMIKTQLLRLFEREMFSVQYIGDEIWQEPALTPPTTDLLEFADGLNAGREERMAQFVRQHREAFEKIAVFAEGEGARGHRKKSELEAIAALCQEILLRADRTLGVRECNQLSDAVIAVDAPGQAEVCAFDTLFELLCAALGKGFHLFPDLTPRLPLRCYAGP